MSPSSPFAIGLSGLLAVSASAHSAEYSIEPIVSPTGGYVFPSSIASDGLVAGHVKTSTTSCFKYLNGVFTTLPLQPHNLRCQTAVTDLQGNIAMTVVPVDKPGTTRVVELTKRGRFQDLMGLSADGNTVAASKGGFIAGASLSSSGEPQAYIFKRSGPGINVGALTGMPRSWLTGINAKGWAVGMAQAQPGDVPKAFQYRNGKLMWLAPLVPGGDATANGINAEGTVVGSAGTSPGGFGNSHAVTWKGRSAPIDLGSVVGMTYGLAIDVHGTAVGRSGLGYQGVRMREGAFVILQYLISPEQQLEWTTVGEATAISDDGLITGALSEYNGQYGVAYLLRPLR